jgi:hypothetical protein
MERPTTIHNDPTTNHDDPKPATTTHNQPQRSTSSQQSNNNNILCPDHWPPSVNRFHSYSCYRENQGVGKISACASGSLAFSRQFWSHVLISNIKHVGRKRCVWCVQLQIVINIFRPNILVVKNRSLISFALCEKFCSHYEHRLSSCCSAVCASFI